MGDYLRREIFENKIMQSKDGLKKYKNTLIDDINNSYNQKISMIKNSFLSQIKSASLSAHMGMVFGTDANGDFQLTPNETEDDFFAFFNQGPGAIIQRKFDRIHMQRDGNFNDLFPSILRTCT